MNLSAKHQSLKKAYAEILQAGRDPFDVRFDAILSATEGLLGAQRVLLLGTNNYLGLSYDDQCIEASMEAIKTWGTGTTGSRIANGSFGLHVALETELARFFNRTGAMTFTTGYQANIGMISALLGRHDFLLMDEHCHASIYDGARLAGCKSLRFRHNDLDDLYRLLRRVENTPSRCLIAVEGIYSMIGDSAPLNELADLKRDGNALLFVDEAHSLGVLGEHGRGAVEAAGVEDDVDFIVGTFSKSLGAIGGFCVSSVDDFSLLRVLSRPYMFTASLPPAVAASTFSALRQMQARPELRRQVSSNASRLSSGLKKLGFAVGPGTSPIIAVMMPNVEAAVSMWNALLSAGVYLNLALPPATPGGIALLRASVSAAHTEQQLDESLELFRCAAVRIGLLQ